MMRICSTSQVRHARRTQADKDKNSERETSVALASLVNCSERSMFAICQAPSHPVQGVHNTSSLRQAISEFTKFHEVPSFPKISRLLRLYNTMTSLPSLFSISVTLICVHSLYRLASMLEAPWRSEGSYPIRHASSPCFGEP